MIVMALLMAQTTLDTAGVVKGEKVFQQNCAIGYCHGTGGAASRGPRLRDRSFTRAYLEKVVREGVPQTAMPGFSGRLSDADLTAAIDYVASLSAVSGASSTPGALAAPVVEFEAPPEIKRGRDLFFDATRGTRCGTCHAVGGMGNAVGPNLARLTAAQAKAVGDAIRASQPRTVRTVRLRKGESFPAIAVDAKAGKYFDLTTPPPVLRTVEPAQLISANGRARWSHSTIVKGYSGEEIEAVARYIRWVNFKQ
jgi:mono/diheme cytochrome c family protein